jgi:rare lipoprotein A
MKKMLYLATFLLLASNGLFAQSQEGLASYYNDKYHGAKTFSGEPYNKNDFTCAHKNYPMGTNLKVTNLANDKSVVVRVNDRESSSSRIIDVSRAAAKEIGLLSSGTAKVRLEVVANTGKPQEAIAEVPKKVEEKPKPAETPSAVDATPKKETSAPKKEETTPTIPPTAINSAEYEPFDLLAISLKKPEKQGFGVQVAGLSNEESLFKMLESLDDKWFSSVLVSVQKNDKGEPVYKVILGQFETEKEAKAYRSDLKKNKKMDGFVVDLSKLDAKK